MPTFTDYKITVKTTVVISAREAGWEVSSEEFTVTTEGTAGTQARALGAEVASLVKQAAEKAEAHTGAVEINEGKRRGVL